MSLACRSCSAGRFDIALLRNFRFIPVTLMVNTALALALVLAGISLFLSPDPQAKRGRRRAAQVCASIVTLIGLLTLSEHLLDRSLHIHPLPAGEAPRVTLASALGSVALQTTLVLALLGCALLLMDVETLKRRVTERTRELANTKEALQAEIAGRKTSAEALRAANRNLRDTETRLRLLHQLPAVMWSTDKELRVTCSRGAGLAALNSQLNEAKGMTVFEYFQTEKPEFRPIAANLRALNGESLSYEVVSAGRVYTAHVEPLRDPDGAITGTIGVALDITERTRAEEQLRELSSGVLRAQEEERRRLARELHDSTAQDLAGLAMSLRVMQESAAALGPRARQALADSITVAEQCVREIRTVAHLLHPPMLDDQGLHSAVTQYVHGFGQRSGIRVDLDLPPDLGGLPQEVKTALFRIIQENLTNIYRHSGSPTAKVRLVRGPSDILLEVKDEGRGMPALIPKRAGEGTDGIGVGIRGMRERVRQLGGRLEIRSGEGGTTMRAVLPLPTEHASHG